MLPPTLLDLGVLGQQPISGQPSCFAAPLKLRSNAWLSIQPTHCNPLAALSLITSQPFFSGTFLFTYVRPEPRAYPYSLANNTALNL